MKKIAILLIGNLKLDNRVKRVQSSFIKNEDQPDIVYYNLDVECSYTMAHTQKIKLWTSFLPRGGKYAVVKYAEWLVKTVRKISRYDVLYANDLETLPAAFVSKFLFNRRQVIIYDAHENSVENVGGNLLRKRIVFFFEKLLLRQVDIFVSVNSTIVEDYKQKYHLKIPSLTLRNIPVANKTQNDALERSIRSIRKTNPDWPIYLWHGYFSQGRGIEVVLDCLRNNCVQANIVFVGQGSLRGKIQSCGLKNVHCFDAIELSELINAMYLFDAGLFTYSNKNGNYDVALPNKFFEFLIGGLPILSTPLKVVSGEITKHSLGCISKDFGSDALLSLLEIRRDKLASFRPSVEKYSRALNWDTDFKKILELL